MNSERLCDVVVCAGIQCKNLIVFRSPRGENQDWDFAPLSYLARDFDTVQIRQP